MLGKLMKYEFMAMGRIILPMYGALLALSLISRALMLLPARAPMTISTVVASVMIAALFIITFILTLQRFMKNLLSEEGYLMMTLPVKTDYLILSKLFVATIFSFASVIVASVAIFILASFDFAGLFRELGILLSYIDFQGTIQLIQALIIMVLSVFASILLLYTCMALSLLVSKRRGLFSFGAFVVLTTVLQIFTTISISIMVIPNVDNAIERFLFGMSDFATTQVAVSIIIVISLALCAAFYAITRHMLKRRLNLQ